jgi:hypothetical protein
LILLNSLSVLSNNLKGVKKRAAAVPLGSPFLPFKNQKFCDADVPVGMWSKVSISPESPERSVGEPKADPGGSAAGPKGRPHTHGLDTPAPPTADLKQNMNTIIV